MSFTSTDLDNIDLALVAFATGDRVGWVTIGDHTIKYADTSLTDLQRLRDIIKSDVDNDAGAWCPRTYAKNGGRGA